MIQKSSFENVPKWMKEIEKHAKPDVNVIFVGNKSDLIEKREVKFEEAQVNFSVLIIMKPL